MYNIIQDIKGHISNCYTRINRRKQRIKRHNKLTLMKVKPLGANKCIAFLLLLWDHHLGPEEFYIIWYPPHFISKYFLRHGKYHLPLYWHCLVTNWTSFMFVEIKSYFVTSKSTNKQHDFLADSMLSLLSTFFTYKLEASSIWWMFKNSKHWRCVIATNIKGI